MNSRLIFLVAACLVHCAPGQEPVPFDTVIVGGTVIDGTGTDGRRVDVGIREGRIAALGQLADQPAKRAIDASGLIVAPGFIDGHAHADAAAARHPKASNFLLMGVTSIITGNCGGSVKDLGAHFEKLKSGGISLNYGSLVGHNTVRTAVLGTADRDPTAEELAKMQELVRAAMDAGAQGLSTGLIYVPGTYAGTEEIIELARVVGQRGGIYVSHMRNEGSRVLESIEEALRIGREAGVPIHLSHLKASGKPNWGAGERIVARLRKARSEGIGVTGDQYAYAASSTSLDVLFPAKELRITRPRFARKLKTDPAFRDRMEKALIETMDNAGFGDLSYCQVAFAPENAELSGLNLKEVARRRERKVDRETQARVTVDIYIESKGRRISMVYHKMTESDVEAIMRSPFVAVACDAGIRVKGRSRPHPRGCGNNPRVLGRYVRERGVIPLATAVHKMTGLPARIFSLADRGVIRLGAWADLTLFSAGTVLDQATYDEPFAAPKGIPWVLVNGQVVVEEGRHTGARPGHVLRRGSGGR